VSAGVITWSGDPIEPAVIEEYETANAAGNIVHSILGVEAPDVTLRPAGLRTGTIALTFDTEAESALARTAHGLPEVFTLTVTGRSYLDMTYVLGQSGILSYRTAAGRYVVEVGFQEVAA
jgi:hypothetical protein